MDTLKCSNLEEFSSRLVEPKELWGYRYYVEVKNDRPSVAQQKLLRVRDSEDISKSNVFGGADDD